MNNSWNLAKFGLVLLALPLVATAAASAHLQIVQSSPISVSTDVYAAPEATIGLDRVHTVALNQNGGVDGRIVIFDANSTVKGLENLEVRFVKNGKTIRQATTDSTGVFAVENIPEGIYSFIASGNNGFAAYSVRVVDDSTGTYQDVMEAAAVSQVASVKSIIDTAPEAVASSTEQVAMDENGANRVVLKNGTLSGRILSPTTDGVEDTQVHILKDGIPVATVMVNEQGEYKVPDMKPGVYAMVAVGPRGIAAVAFEAVEFDDQVSKPARGITYVSTGPQDVAPQDGVGQNTPIYTDVLNVYMINPQDNVQQQQPIVQDPIFDEGGFLPIEFAGQDVTFGGAGGSFPTSQTVPTGGGGGGGGRFGGGRFIGLAGLAGLAGLGGGGSTPTMSPVIP